MDIYDRMTIDVPEGELDGLRVQRFEVKPGTVQGLRLAMRGRPIRPGWYTRLVDGQGMDARFWMSDTPAEKYDHYQAIGMIEKLQAKRVLINGLGLGMVVQAALSFNHVERVDVVERDQRVIDLVGPHYLKDPRVTIIHADAFEQAKVWPKGTRWDVVWSDIWGDITTDDLPEHTKLARSYGRRATWHGAWVHDVLMLRRARERREKARQREWLS
jgi:hypothetical protein